MSDRFLNQFSTSLSDTQPVPWHTFMDILQGLHRDGIYLHPDQLAEFFVRHGLPVDLQYVPGHLQERARHINTYYQGDMARVEEGRESTVFWLD